MKPTRRPSASLESETDLLVNTQSPHKLSSTLKFTVFGSSSSLPPLVGVRVCRTLLVCESVGKADLLSYILF